MREIGSSSLVPWKDKENEKTHCLILQVWHELRRDLILAQAGLPVLLKPPTDEIAHRRWTLCRKYIWKSLRPKP
jgi:hypothetical protein